MTNPRSILSKLTAIVMILSMVFRVSASSANPFKDVEADKWYYGDILRANAEGIMTGTASDTFEPNALMTREMFVTALRRMSMVTTYYEGLTKYKDVKTGSWYNDSVLWAEDLNVTNGVSDDAFGTGRPVTREQIATFIYRYLNNSIIAAELKNDASPEQSFSDKPSDYALEAVEVMRKTGIIKGYGDGKFNPRAYATRAEVATILVRLKDALQDAGYRFNINPENVSKIDVRWQAADENGEIPKTKSVTDSSELKRALQYINDALITAVIRKEPTDGWTYDLRVYDKSGKCSFGFIIEPYSARINNYVYDTAAFEPFVVWITA